MTKEPKYALLDRGTWVNDFDEEGKDYDDEILRLFCRLVLGYPSTANQTDSEIDTILKTYSKAIQFFVCANDDVVNNDKVPSFLNDKSAFAEPTQIEDVSHFLFNDENWLGEEGDRAVQTILSSVLRHK